MFQIDVHATGPDGCDITGLRIPGVLVTSAMHFVPDDALCDASEELQRWGPIAREVCEALARSPDFVLVQVESNDEQVNISKRGHELVVEVETDCESVHVVVPLRAMNSILKRMERG
jgi:hypothetical protein